MPTKSEGNILVIDPLEDLEVLKGLASKIRIDILNLLRKKDLNVNELVASLNLPQSTVATNVMILEKNGLIKTVNKKATKGSQKISYSLYDDFLISFPKNEKVAEDVVEVEMPIGLFTSYHVSPPCGLCTPEKIVGFLDSPHSFLDPERVKAGLLWFESGYVEYKFPNNLMHKRKPVKKIEVIMEVSSESLTTDRNWPSDITLSINRKEIGFWTSPGDFGGQRGKLTPDWWRINNSQYGLIKTWSVTEQGAYVDGVQISAVTLADLNLMDHHSIRIRIEVKEDAEHRGGLNLFGNGFGNYDYDLILRALF